MLKKSAIWCSAIILFVISVYSGWVFRYNFMELMEEAKEDKLTAEIILNLKYKEYFLCYNPQIANMIEKHYPRFCKNAKRAMNENIIFSTLNKALWNTIIKLKPMLWWVRLFGFVVIGVLVFTISTTFSWWLKNTIFKVNGKRSSGYSERSDSQIISTDEQLNGRQKYRKSSTGAQRLIRIESVE